MPEIQISRSDRMAAESLAMNVSREIGLLPDPGKEVFLIALHRICGGELAAAMDRLKNRGQTGPGRSYGVIEPSTGNDRYPPPET